MELDIKIFYMRFKGVFKGFISVNQWHQNKWVSQQIFAVLFIWKFNNEYKYWS